MTGFAVCHGEGEGFSWCWEIKSVNAKGLDIRCRLPTGFESIEQAIREKIRSRLRRGNVNLSLTIDCERTNGAFNVNHDALNHVISLVEEIRQQLPESQPPSAEAILCVKGVLEPADDTPGDELLATIRSAAFDGLDDALSSLEEMRAKEGERLALVFDRQVGEIRRLCDDACGLAALQPEAIHQRLKAQVDNLMQAEPSLPEERLAGEAAMLIAKADVREELDRIKSHIAATGELLKQGQAIGRKLDFLCQELNREVNTLCSKSTDMELTVIGLGLKAAVEQFREQVQNIE